MQIRTLCTLLLAGSLAACNNSSGNNESKDSTVTSPDSTMSAAADSTPTVNQIPSGIHDETISYGNNMKGFLAYADSSTTPKPAVLIIPEWWGLTDYAKNRARQIAGLGYTAFVVDMYGDGKTADNPTDAGKLAGPFYGDQLKLQATVKAAYDKVITLTQVNRDKIGIMGYCFGGYVAINSAKSGLPYLGVVSFHGGLGGPAPTKNAINEPLLILNGSDDKMVSEAERAQFKKSMDSVGVHYQYIDYPGAIHAFTNPDATAIGEKYKIPVGYNSAADHGSWEEMKSFWAKQLK